MSVGKSSLSALRIERQRKVCLHDAVLVFENVYKGFLEIKTEHWLNARRKDCHKSVDLQTLEGVHLSSV